MTALRTTNPLLNEQAFSPQQAWGNLERDRASQSVMTLQGAVNATAVLMSITCVVAIAVWVLREQLPVLWMMLGGSVAGCLLCLVMSFKNTLAPWIAAPVAICQGLFAGGASVMWSVYAQRGDMSSTLGIGLVLQAVLLTIGIAFGLLLLYTTRIIKATENFKLAVGAATLGICFVSIISLVLSLFGIKIPYLWSNGIIGIGFAGFIVVVAALNLVLDFDFIEDGSKNRLPRHMNWFAAIGVLVTIVWLYVSILRLLALLKSRE